jgi:N-acetylmuramoyl-L-alanine amidase
MATAGPTATNPPVTVVVQPGDTLSSIAARHHTSVAALVQANSLADPDVVPIGRTLRVPPGSAPRAGTGALPDKLLAHPDRLALRPMFERWATRYGVAPDLLEALCWVESGWQRSVVSSAGAVGIGQLVPDAVAHMRDVIGNSALDPKVPEDNIRMSARLLRLLLDGTGGKVELAVAGYYQGATSVRRDGLRPGTFTYVAAVLAFQPRFS